MIGRTHDLGAITALLVIILITMPSYNFTLATALVAVLFNQIGGILPDIDQPTAPLWRNLPIGKVFGRTFDTLLGGHRFLTHSLLGVGLFSFLGWLLLNFIHPLMPTVDINLVWWAFLIGILSHLLMDTFTKEGVPWLLPIPLKIGLPPAKSMRITAGKKFESLIVFPGLIVVDIWLCVTHYSYLLSLIHQHLI